MLKIGFIGVTAALLATFLKKERAELSVLLCIVAGGLIFSYVLTEISVVVGFVKELLGMVAVEESYYMQLLKMLGVAYMAEFATSICKDAGYGSIGNMVELFAKILIVTLSVPGLVFLVQTLEQFV